MADDDIDDEQIENLPAPALYDRFGDALALLAAVTNPKAARKQVLARRRWERDKTAAAQEVAAMTAAAEQREAALDARAAACAERERTCDERDAVFERQATAALSFGYAAPVLEPPSWQTTSRDDLETR